MRVQTLNDPTHEKNYIKLNIIIRNDAVTLYYKHTHIPEALDPDELSLMTFLVNK